MKKILILLLCLLLTASITGCGTQSIKPIDTIEGNMKTYSEMSDGTWPVSYTHLDVYKRQGVQIVYSGNTTVCLPGSSGEIRGGSQI